jgi:hypothetical protein
VLVLATLVVGLVLVLPWRRGVLGALLPVPLTARISTTMSTTTAIATATTAAGFAPHQVADETSEVR